MILLVLFLLFFKNIIGSIVIDSSKTETISDPLNLTEEEMFEKLATLSSNKSQVVVVFKKGEKVGEFKESIGKDFYEGTKTLMKLDSLFGTPFIKESYNIFSRIDHFIVFKDPAQSFYLGDKSVIP